MLCQALELSNFAFSEVTSESDVSFRLIHYEPKLLVHPIFITLEFHERPGVLAEFLRVLSPHSNLCYFNYVYSGERVGRALLGFEFESREQYSKFDQVLDSAKHAYRDCRRVSEDAMKRIVS